LSEKLNVMNFSYKNEIWMIFLKFVRPWIVKYFLLHWSKG
jgi:hypothetical protein